MPFDKHQPPHLSTEAISGLLPRAKREQTVSTTLDRIDLASSIGAGTLVLMCIAYFQPITRGELSSFFGKEVSRDLIGILRSQDLIASGPRSPQPGAPYTYVTTKAFLSHFGFDTLRDLPDFEALEDAGLLSKEKLLAGDVPIGLTSEEGDDEADITAGEDL
jgi:chromosome segregation and condensation protein ScpB